MGFRKGKSTVDVIQEVVDISTKARRGTGKRKGFCALISIDIRNAFNTARWSICMEAIVRKKFPDYLLRMIDDYLSDRWVIYESNKWYLKDEMTFGTPQGSRVSPLVWNHMYDDFLRMDLPAETSLVGFADDALVVCAADDVRILELRINESLWQAKRWLDGRGLKMAPEETEALLVTDRRSFQYSRIVLGEHEIEWKKSIKYLGVQLDRRLSFGDYLQIATAKAIQCGPALTRLMPNIGDPRKAKRRLVASVVNSKLLYADPVWTSALNNYAIQKKLFSAQRGVVLRIVSACRTVSTSAVLVLASVPPKDLLVEERKEIFQLHKELICLTNLQEIYTGHIQVVGGNITSQKLFVLVMNVYVATQEKHFFTRVIVALNLLGHQTLHSQNKLLFSELHNILFSTK